MEKQTIGKLIAVLRKANGMTQKQLADRLCVSDKAVSRWERDACAPDLSLIPVIAEIFGITTDELLRGQRNNPESPSPANQEAKAELQKRRLVKDAKTKYHIRSLICLCVALVGVIAALVCNFGFLRAYIAFGIGAAFCTVAAILQAVFTVSAQAAVDGEDVEDALLQDYRLLLFRVCRNRYTVILIVLALLLPMLMVPDTYAGIDFGSWLLYGLVFAAIMLLLCLTVGALTLLHLSKQRFLSPEDSSIGNAQLSIRWIGTFAAVTAFLFLTQSILNSYLPGLLTKGTVFYTWGEFKTFMETPVLDEPVVGDTIFEFADISVPSQIEPIPSIAPGEEYTDTTIFEDTEQITANDGRVLCEFVARNEALARIEPSNTGDGLPVTVYTYDDYRQANLILDDLINPLFLLAYLANGLVCFLAYRKRSARLL